MMEHIRALREDRDLKQKDLAEFLNITQSTYSDYERGNVNIPIAALIRLALFYGTSIDYMLELTDDPRPYPRKKHYRKRTPWKTLF